jgi:hypothetical protein
MDKTLKRLLDVNKGKTNDNMTDNKDSNNNNKCVSVTLSVKTLKKMGKGFTI